MPPGSLARSGIRSCAFPPRMAPAILGIWPGSSAPRQSCDPGTSNLTAFHLTGPLFLLCCRRGSVGAHSTSEAAAGHPCGSHTPSQPRTFSSPVTAHATPQGHRPSLQRERAVPTSPTPAPSTELGVPRGFPPRAEAEKLTLKQAHPGNTDQERGRNRVLVLVCFEGHLGMYSSPLCSEETDFCIVVQTPVRWPLAVVSSPSLGEFKKKLDCACRKRSSVPPPILRVSISVNLGRSWAGTHPGPLFLALKLAS